MSATVNGTTTPDRLARRADARDPLEGVLAIHPRLPVTVMLIAGVLALSVHAGAAVGAVQAALTHAFDTWARDVNEFIAQEIGQTYELEVAKEEPPPPEPEPQPEPEPEPEAVAEPPPIKEAPPPDAKPQPPAASDAAKVLTQEPRDDEPVNLTESFLNGEAETANGGVTQRGGTSKVANYNPHALATGTPGGTGTAPVPAAPRVDRSRAARISNLSNLERCPFPPEADADQIDEAVVGIEVRVSTGGRAENVSITSDPGHGFGREAKKCALRERYETALDVDGNAIPGLFRVRFRFSR